MTLNRSWLSFNLFNYFTFLKLILIPKGLFKTSIQQQQNTMLVGTFCQDLNEKLYY